MCFLYTLRGICINLLNRTFDKSRHELINRVDRLIVMNTIGQSVSEVYRNYLNIQINRQVK